MPGPRPKPTMLKILQGNPGRKPLNTREPMPDRISAPEPPEHLLPLAKEKWRELAPQPCRLQLLSGLDTDLLEVFCDAYAKKRAADDYLKERGTTYAEAGNKVYRQYPQVSISERCVALMLACGDRLGLSPSARSRIQIADNGKPQTRVAVRLLGD